jgi:hypothetical protein
MLVHVGVFVLMLVLMNFLPAVGVLVGLGLAVIATAVLAHIVAPFRLNCFPLWRVCIRSIPLASPARKFFPCTGRKNFACPVARFSHEIRIRRRPGARRAVRCRDQPSRPAT